MKQIDTRTARAKIFVINTENSLKKLRHEVYLICLRIQSLNEKINCKQDKIPRVRGKVERKDDNRGSI